MKYCPKCKVNVNNRHDNCPLCGAFLIESDKLEYEYYEKEIEPKVSYPELKLNEQADFLKTKNNYIFLLAMAICVALNILLTKNGFWSAYVVIGGIFAIFCVFLPINRKSKVYIQIMTDLPILTALSFAFELFATNFTSVRITICYVLPSLYLLAIALTDFMIVLTTKERASGYFTTLLAVTIYAIIPQILIWCWLYKLNFDSLVAFISFFVAVLNIGVVSICAHNRIKEEYSRKMNL